VPSTSTVWLFAHRGENDFTADVVLTGAAVREGRSAATSQPAPRARHVATIARPGGHRSVERTTCAPALRTRERVIGVVV
jgi:hypothetical protein